MDRADTDTDRERWAMFVVPLLVVLSIGLLAIGLNVMRRRYGLQPGAFPSRRPGGANDPSYYHSYQSHGSAWRRGDRFHPYAGLGNGRDVEETAAIGYRPRDRPPQRDQQQVGYHGGPPGAGRAVNNDSNRWTVGRREEGLNELGEAPPPYVGGGERKKGPDDGIPAAGTTGASDVEMARLDGRGEGAQEGTPATTPPTVAEAPPPPPPPAAVDFGSSPPAYREAAAAVAEGVVTSSPARAGTRGDGRS